jgi:membrane-bound metal-dependent hydrolase YbcI (DUF457 family)
MFEGLRDHISSTSERKIISAEIVLIVISLALLYPLLSVDNELIGIFAAISLASVLIPVNTYAYLRGFHRTAVASLIFAYVVPWVTFFLIVFSPGTNSIGAAILFFVVLSPDSPFLQKEKGE